MALTKEQFARLYERGLSVEQIMAFESGKKPEDLKKEMTQTTQEDGFFKSLVKAPIETLLVRPAARTAEALGRMGVFGKTIKRGYEDMADSGQQLDTVAGKYDISPVKEGADGAKQILGESLESASYLIPAGRIEAVASNLFKGNILRATAAGAASGGAAGGLFSAGEGLQANKTADEITYDTLFGTATGALAGGLFSGLGATASKAFNNLKEYRVPESARQKLSEAYEEVINPTQRQRRVLTGEGRNMGEFLVDELGDDPGIKLTADGKLDLTDPLESLKTKYEAEELAFDRLLESDIRQFNWTDVRRKALVKINQRLNGTERQRAIRALDEELVAYADQFGDTPNLSQINQFKRDMWTRTTGFGSPEAEFARKTNFNLGQAAKEFVEDAVDDIKIKDFNKRLGDFISTIKVLENRQGGVPGTGGKMQRYFTRAVGAIAGGGGGPLGTLVGAISGDKIAGLMANPEVRFALLRRLMKNLPENQRNQIVSQAQQILETRAKQASERLLLPSPSYIPLGPKTPNQSTVQSVRATPGLVGKDPKTGRFFRTYRSN